MNLNGALHWFLLQADFFLLILFSSLVKILNYNCLRLRRCVSSVTVWPGRTTPGFSWPRRRSTCSSTPWSPSSSSSQTFARASSIWSPRCPSPSPRTIEFILDPRYLELEFDISGCETHICSGQFRYLNPQITCLELFAFVDDILMLRFNRNRYSGELNFYSV